MLSGKLLSSTLLDRTRTEEAWSTLLKPYETSKAQVAAIFFGSAPKVVQTEENTRPRYELEMFSPSSSDGGLIKYLEHHMVRRRENIVLVGLAGCGKSCLIQTLTVKFGVQYFGTADELREVSESVEFVVFDDFDFTDFTVDDMKRLLDREFDSQRVKVRYKDALLKKRMTRIILCNEVPKCLEDAAVQDRYLLLCM
jgi:Fe-S cluster biogenesis protein NfuA